MSQKENLIERLKGRPKDFTIDELISLMTRCGCEKMNRGKTSGSAIAFVHSKTGRKMNIHSPHPNKELKMYVVDKAIEFLKEVNEI